MCIPQNTRTLQAVKDAIVTELERLPLEFYRRACQSVPKRLHLCKDVGGEHIERFS